MQFFGNFTFKTDTPQNPFLKYYQQGTKPNPNPYNNPVQNMPVVSNPQIEQQQKQTTPQNKPMPIQRESSRQIKIKEQQNDEYYRILENCINSRTKYTDKEFPPNQRSLTGNDAQYVQRFGSFGWLRPEEFLQNQQIKVFEGGIDPNDVLQGQLGDCYFLCTLSSLAENENRIKRMFVDENNNYSLDQILQKGIEIGCFFVNVYDKGEKKKIIIDDFFPCDNRNSPCFTRANGNELWVMILEKAWAKIYGSYGMIEAGLTRECLHDLTGAPTKTMFNDEDHHEIWQNIIKGEQNNYAMTCGTANTQGIEAINDYGIAGGHAYSLLAGYEIQFRGQMVKLVKIRNPWGDKEWLGRWSDNSPEWDQVDQRVKYDLQMTRKDNDGVFFMQFEDFVQQFYDFQFCLVNDSFKYNYVKCVSTNKRGKLFKIDIRTSGQYYFTVNQTSKRKFPKSVQTDFKYNYVTMVLAKLNRDGSLKFIEDTQKADREVWTAKGENQMIEAGQYLLFAKVQWNVKQSDEFVLSAYGSDDVDIQETNQMDNKEFLNEVYLDYSKNVSQKVKNFAQRGHANKFYCVDRTDGGYQFLSAWNNDSVNGGNTLMVQMQIKTMGEQMKLKKPFSGTEAKLVVPPMQSRIALIRIKNNSGFSFSYGLMTGFQ